MRYYDDNSWEVYSKKILSDLERLGQQYDKLAYEVYHMKASVDVVKTKVSMWSGGIGFVVAAVTSFIIKYLAG